MQEDFLNGSIRPLYFRYLGAAFGSALLTSIYGIVDMAMVGQYQGPDGTAALAVVMPLYNIIYSLGLLMGIGGSVLFSTIRGKGENEENRKRSNEYFTAAMIGAICLAAIVWIGIGFFDRQLLTVFGASETLLPLNIFSTYYFQALLQPRAAFVTSVARGCVISGILIFLLPVLAGTDAIWFAMPVTELLTAVYVINRMFFYTKQLPVENSGTKSRNGRFV